MTPNRLRSRAASWAGLALASTVLLTGCDTTVPAFSPGVAAQVGDDTISLSEVDDVSNHYCAAAEKQFEEGQVVAQHYLRGLVAGNLALRSAADQFADEMGVSADAEYAKAEDAARSSLTGLSEAQVQAVIDVQGAETYLGAIEKSAGAQLLADQGNDAAGDKAARAAGKKAFTDWLADQDVDIDPKFGVSIADGKSTPTDTSLSYAVSNTATTADADQADPVYAAALADPQRCG